VVFDEKKKTQVRGMPLRQILKKKNKERLTRVRGESPCKGEELKRRTRETNSLGGPKPSVVRCGENGTREQETVNGGGV